MIIFSDLHLEPSSADVALEVLRTIPKLMEKHDDGHVVFLGDFWMVRHMLSVRLLLEAHGILREWKASRVDVTPGNHDQISTDGRNALEVFNDLPAFRVHTEPTEESYGLFLPWLHDRRRVIEVLRGWAEAKTGKPLFAHLAVHGAWMNNLKKCDEGVQLKALNPFKHVFLGHYHRHQVLRKGALYVGSPYQVSYAEAGQSKGYVHFDGKFARFHALDIGPKHHKLVVDADHPEGIHIPQLADGDKLWVHVKGSTANIMRGHLEDQLVKAGYDVNRIDVDLQPTNATARINLDEGAGVDAFSAQYLDAQDIDEDYKTQLRVAWAELRFN